MEVRTAVPSSIDHRPKLSAHLLVQSSNFPADSDFLLPQLVLDLLHLTPRLILHPNLHIERFRPHHLLSIPFLSLQPAHPHLHLQHHRSLRPQEPVHVLRQVVERHRALPREQPLHRPVALDPGISDQALALGVGPELLEDRDAVEGGVAEEVGQGGDEGEALRRVREVNRNSGGEGLVGWDRERQAGDRRRGGRALPLRDEQKALAAD